MHMHFCLESMTSGTVLEGSTVLQKLRLGGVRLENTVMKAC